MLSVLSLVAGFLALPRAWTAWQPFAGFLTTSVPATVTKGLTSATWLTTAVETAVTLVGLLAAWWVYLRRAAREGWALAPSTSRAALFLSRGWGFDWLYDTVFVAPAGGSPTSRATTSSSRWSAASPPSPGPPTAA